VKGADKTAKEDDFVTFFMHCWHIKNHVDKDPTLHDDVRERLVLAAHASPQLNVCQQIANGMKHFTKYPAEMKGHNDLTVLLQTGTSAVHPLITLENSDQKRAANVAREALAGWKSARDIAWPAPEKGEPPLGGDAQKPAA
jgi:hypothetical protein